jgi:aspartate-semialdehyde dehydrogenase
MVAEDRRAGRRRYRQFLGLAHGPGVVPEVNADAVSGFTRKNIIANPNCSTTQLVVALKPLHEKARIKRVVVATYQSVFGAGKEAMDELFSQSKAVFTLDEVEANKFSKRIAFNVIPHIDVFMEDGYTKEEGKMVVETKKIGCNLYQPYPRRCNDRKRTADVGRQPAQRRCASAGRRKGPPIGRQKRGLTNIRA